MTEQEPLEVTAFTWEKEHPKERSGELTVNREWDGRQYFASIELDAEYGRVEIAADPEKARALAYRLLRVADECERETELYQVADLLRESELWMSVDALAANTGLPKSDVRDELEDLKAAGQIERRPGDVYDGPVVRWSE